MTGIVFEAWPKIARLNRNIVVTEKIDGTNAAIIITNDGEVGAQSRSRLITPEQDNFGFAAWVQKNREALVEALGEGRHFGEWWGSGIQRGYGLVKGEKRFSLFNSERWDIRNPAIKVQLEAVEGLGVVPVLYRGPFDQGQISEALRQLDVSGSAAAPSFENPEGIVVYVAAARQMFKVTIKGDAAPKGVAGHAGDEEIAA